MSPADVYYGPTEKVAPDPLVAGWRLGRRRKFRRGVQTEWYMLAFILGSIDLRLED